MSQSEPTDYLSPSEFIESDAESICARAASLARETPAETAIALFNWVRDHIKYDPHGDLPFEDLHRNVMKTYGRALTLPGGRERS